MTEGKIIDWEEGWGLAKGSFCLLEDRKKKYSAEKTEKEQPMGWMKT